MAATLRRTAAPIVRASSAGRKAGMGRNQFEAAVASGRRFSLVNNLGHSISMNTTPEIKFLRGTVAFHLPLEASTRKRMATRALT